MITKSVKIVCTFPSIERFGNGYLNWYKRYLTNILDATLSLGSFYALKCSHSLYNISMLCLGTLLQSRLAMMFKSCSMHKTCVSIAIITIITICDRIWENVHSSHIRFCSFEIYKKHMDWHTDLKLSRMIKILVVQTLKLSYLCVIPNRYYESFRLKIGCVNFACFPKSGHIYSYALRKYISKSCNAFLN